MTTAVLHIVYAEFGRDRAPLAWRDGVTLTEDQTSERQDLHREISGLVRRAPIDRTGEWGRVVRTGTTLLMETRADDGSGERRVDVTAMLQVPDGTADVSSVAADMAKILADAGVAVDIERLTAALRHACEEDRSGPFASSPGRLWAGLVALGVTLLI